MRVALQKRQGLKERFGSGSLNNQEMEASFAVQRALRKAGAWNAYKESKKKMEE
jgi:hypothetical protein